MKLEERVGEKLMIGVHGTRVTREMLAQFRRTNAGGVIFFRPNFKSAAAFRQMVADLERSLGRRLLIAVDHEGGRVIHLAEGVTVFPDNLCVANAGNPAAAAAQGKIEARELASLGIDLNLAPTVDVLTAKFSPNIGIRSYGPDPGLVSQFAAARIRAMQAGGVAACVKHFPGQGQSALDAHRYLPVLTTSPKEMDEVHLAPFRSAIRAGVRAVMSSHPVYPKLDPEKIPATFSRKIIDGLLRGRLGFRGVVFSDDLEMGALRKWGSAGRRAVRAVRAGHDIILFCHDTRSQVEAHAALCRATRRGELDWRKLRQSAERIHELKDFGAANRARRRKITFGRPTSSLPLQIARRGIRTNLCRAHLSVPYIKRDSEVPGASGQALDPALVIFPRLSELDSKIFIEKEMLNERIFLRRLLRKEAGRPAASLFLTGLEPSRREIKSVIRKAQSAALVIYFCTDAHLLAGCRRLLEGLQGWAGGGGGRAASKLVTVFLRDPTDARFLKKGAPFVQTFGFRAVQIRAALERIFKISR